MKKLSNTEAELKKKALLMKKMCNAFVSKCIKWPIKNPKCKIWAFYKKQFQKQPSRGVLRKRCSFNMHQIYRRTPMPKCDFNVVANQLYWNHTSAWVFSCKLPAYFQNTFSWEHLWRAASAIFNCMKSFVSILNSKFLFSSLYIKKIHFVHFEECFTT